MSGSAIFYIKSIDIYIVNYVYIIMKLKLCNHFPLPIKAQIKRQISAMIQDGRLRAGDILMSAKDLGAFLNINRNTAATAYKELEQDGVLTIIKGSGTYVKKCPACSGQKELTRIFKRAFFEARQAGFSDREISDCFITGLLEKCTTEQREKKLILIDCNFEVLDTLEAKLKARIPCDTRSLLIQDIQTHPENFLKEAKIVDLVLCGMNHLEELRSAVGDLTFPTVGFLIRTDFHIMNQILQLPAGTKVGYCCISKKSSTAFFSSAMFSSGTTLERFHAGIDDKKAVLKMLADCQIIFATHYVYDHLKKEYPKTQNIHKVMLDIDPQNFEYIITALEKETSS